MRRALVVGAAILVLMGTTSMASAGTAHSPKERWVEVWEPFRWQAVVGPEAGDNLEDRVHDPEDQGYTTVYRRYDDNGTDAGYGGCTVANWEAIPTGTGILLIVTHGATGFLDVVCSTEEGAEDWVDDLADGDDVEAFDSGPCDWAVKVKSPWFARNWDDLDNDHNRAITYVVSCEGFEAPTGGSSILESIKGRVRFAYSGCPASFSVCENDVDLLFHRMNGNLPDNNKGTLRKAGAAREAGYFDTGTQLKIAGEGDTTLCPAPAGYAGGGDTLVCRIWFDTHCDDTENINNVLVLTPTNCTITSKKWNNDEELEFTWTHGCDPWSIGVHVEADYVQQESHGACAELYMDGNRYADSKDDYEFTLSPE